VSDPISVILVDDHSIVRRGIKALLDTEQDIQVVGEAENGIEAVELACEIVPDVILMDLEMPKMDGIEAIQRILPSCPDIGILVLTSFTTDHRVFSAIKAGAHGYLLKDSEPEQLLNAIRRVHRREPSLHPTIARKLLDELPETNAEHSPTANLSEEEVAVLKLLAAGRDTVEIAGGVATSPELVRSHIASILRKLRLASRTQAVLYALQEGLATPDETAPEYLQKLLDAFREFDQDGTVKAKPHAQGSGRVAGDFNLAELIDEYSEVTEERTLAGQIQSTFLPEMAPSLQGWEIAATLLPAKEVSGDFYDFLQLPDDRIALVIADVTNKGMGAALFMALSRTLVRTYAMQHPQDPHLVLQDVNRRILADTHGGPYVTLLFAVIDPANGDLRYASAGHPPGYILRESAASELDVLPRTGPPLGAYEEAIWGSGNLTLTPGDMLLLYTDGIPEAQNAAREFFGAEQLEDAILENRNQPVGIAVQSLLNRVQQFAGEASRSDDITVIGLVRDRTG
jgi:NarL family two-component system response regulator LiaR